jgi:tetratricopeptide (TPR) repeat protein
MIRIQRAFLVALSLALALAVPLHAVGEGRLLGTVVDQSGAPIAGAKAILTSPNSSYKQERSSDSRGKFTLIVLDATRKYVLRLEKEGFQPLEGPVDIKVGDPTNESFTMVPVPKPTGPAPGSREAIELEGKSKAITAFNEGVGLLNGNDLGGAAAKFQEAATLDPKLAPAHAALAEVLLEQKKYDPALAEIDRYLELDPGKPRGLRVRFDVLKAKGDKAAAAAALDTLVKADPGHESAVRLFNEGAEAVRADDNAAAVQYLKRSLEMDPALDPAYVALGGLYLRHKQYKEARELVDQLLQREPNNLEALTLRAEALKGLGDKAGMQQAEAALKAATTSQDVSPDALFKQGITLYNAGNIKEARATFERVAAAKPDFAKVHYMLGLSYANLNETAKAKEHFETFLKLAPNDPDAGTAKEMLGYLK